RDIDSFPSALSEPDRAAELVVLFSAPCVSATAAADAGEVVAFIAEDVLPRPTSDVRWVRPGRSISRTPRKSAQTRTVRPKAHVTKSSRRVGSGARSLKMSSSESWLGSTL